MHGFIHKTIFSEVQEEEEEDEGGPAPGALAQAGTAQNKGAVVFPAAPATPIVTWPRCTPGGVLQNKSLKPREAFLLL